jgi:predicted dithiol-disulfide oxidoreductase (DUF899 family)
MSARAAPMPAIASPDVWQAERQALLAEEKALTRALDAVAARRRALPWVPVEKDYRFTGEDGPLGLGDLFGRNSQLVVYHFMFGPGWQEGCSGCSFLADHLDGANLHLRHHDVSLVAVSRAPLAEFLPFKQRMGWRFAWVSSAGSDFNRDFHATDEQGSEHHGVSVFAKDAAGHVFHTYSTYARGCDILLGAHNLLDMTPKGRSETGVMDWVRHHDRYDHPSA